MYTVSNFSVYQITKFLLYYFSYFAFPATEAILNSKQIEYTMYMKYLL